MEEARLTTFAQLISSHTVSTTNSSNIMGNQAWNQQHQPNGLSNSTVTTSSRTGPRRCGFPECLKTAKLGGFCISHGGGKKCSVEGCTTSIVSRGFCVAHGGGKRCQHAGGCTKSAQTGGFCWIHGGGKKCGYQGCSKRAQSGGACISHGGGKRCRMPQCNKVVQYDGLCVGHGGYRRCLSINCTKKALANRYCPAHGGNSQCSIANCGKKAVRGGYCGDHKHTLMTTVSSPSSPSPPSSTHQTLRVEAKICSSSTGELLRQASPATSSSPSFDPQIHISNKYTSAPSDRLIANCLAFPHSSSAVTTSPPYMDGGRIAPPPSAVKVTSAPPSPILKPLPAIGEFLNRPTMWTPSINKTHSSLDLRIKMQSIGNENQFKPLNAFPHTPIIKPLQSYLGSPISGSDSSPGTSPLVPSALNVGRLMAVQRRIDKGRVYNV